MNAEFRDKLESELELLSAEASITGMNRDDFSSCAMKYIPK